MSTSPARAPWTCRHQGPPTDVITWRRCRLLEAGLSPDLAAQVAASAVDVHALLQLVDRGCPPDLALRILAPYEPVDLSDLTGGAA